jgi:hypothetical protein
MMRRLRLFFCLICITTGCGGSYEETIGGVKIPIPRGMTRSRESGIEVSLPGFAGAQAYYQGKLAPDEVVEFYRKEMTTRGWQPSLGLLSKGGMLTCVKDSTTVVIAVGKSDGGTGLTIIAGGAQR